MKKHTIKQDENAKSDRLLTKNILNVTSFSTASFAYELTSSVELFKALGVIIIATNILMASMLAKAAKLQKYPNPS